MDPGADPSSEDYAKVRAVMDRALDELRAAGAQVVDSVVIPELEEVNRIGNSYETEEAVNAYLDELADPPFFRLGQIMGHSTDDPGYLEVLKIREEIRQAVLSAMADHELDALVHATFDHQPTLIAPDVETNPFPDDGYGWGDNRQLSPATGFPALTVPAGFTSDRLPVGLEFLGRPFSEARLLGLGYAYEQATGHRRPPESTPPLR